MYSVEDFSKDLRPLVMVIVPSAKHNVTDSLFSVALLLVLSLLESFISPLLLII